MSSENDKLVLNAIFNPSTPLNLENNEQIEKTLKKSEYQIDDQIESSKKLEQEGVKKAENGDIKAALECFTQAIQIAPHWASAYNNRAQAYRLTNKIDAALTDLNVAIELAHKYKDNKVLSLATVQRGSIYRLQGKNDEALGDFKLAASIGNSFARQQTVAMNPYAALCNQALSEILRKEKAGQS